MDPAARRARADDAFERACRAEARMRACRERYELLSQRAAPMLERGRLRAEEQHATARERAAGVALVAMLARPAGALRPLPGALADR